ncbi:MAG: hypothetical protein KA205_01630 [Acidobacteria bacterium]|nr:hypothetical protein [Acidobacteriota bacterium]
MRRRLVALLALPLLLIGVAASAQTPTPAAKAPDVAGKWTMAMELSIGTSNPVLVLKQDGETITGTYQGRYGEAKLTGKVTADRKIQFTVSLAAEGSDVTMFFSGEVTADGQMLDKGTCNIEGLGDGTWAAKREKTL